METSDYISIIALLVSIGALVYQIYSNRNTIERDLYAAVFREYLMVRIPEGRNQLSIVDGRLHSQQLQQCLSDLRRDILYFKFNNTVFYKALNDIIINIDDLVVSINNEENERDIQSKLMEIDLLINGIYDEVSNVYVHGNR